MKNIAIIRSLAAAILFTVGLFTSSVHAQDSAAVARAERLVTKENATVATLCHPTATLNSLTRVAVSETSSGFRSEYKLSFTSAFGNDFSTSIAFYFDNNGRFARELTVTGTTTYNPAGQPFKAAGMVLNMIKKELLKTRTVQNDAVTVRLIEHADAEVLCELLLWVANQ